MTHYATHPTWLALCAAVKASPDDDLPRLVAADWLDENGDPDRANFIRIQIEYVRSEQENKWGDLVLPAVDLLATHGERWFDFGPKLWRYTSNRRNQALAHCVAHFRRGFLDSAEVLLDEWVKLGPSLVRENPVKSIAVVNKSPTAGTYSWNFMPTPTLMFPDVLPIFLWDYFDGGVWSAGLNYVRRYPTRKAANETLAAACLSWADTATKLLRMGLEPVITQ